MRALISSLFALAFACSAAAADIPQLFAKSDIAGFADAELKVDRTEKASDGSLIVTAAALAGDERVAIQVIVPQQWRSSRAKEAPITLSTGTLRLRSTGKATEAFVRVLATAYHQKVEKFEFAEVELAAISLKGDPSRVASTPVQIKVFYESKNEEEYAEAFVNIDLQRGIVQFHEKDPDYRKAVIGFLSRKTG